MTEGPVQLEWLGEAGQKFTRLIRQPERPGVFVTEVNLPQAGHWTLGVEAPEAAAPVVLENLHVSASNAHDQHSHEPTASEDEGLVRMTKDQQWRLQVAARPVVSEDYIQPLRVAAKVEAPPARRIVVTTQVAGRVGPLEDGSLPALGQRVKAGQPLLQISVPLTGNATDLVAAEAELVRSRESLQLARAELDRATALLEAGAASERRVEEARAALAAAGARHQAAGRLLEGGGPVQIITAPLDGLVVALDAPSGSYVGVGQAVFTVLDPSVVWVRGHIPETALAHLPAAPRARLGIHGDLNLSCSIEGARLVYLAPEIDLASRTVAVVFEVENNDLHLRPGQSLGLALDTSTSGQGLVIPAAALVDEHGRSVVFVQTGGESFVKRYVTLGGQDGRRCLVTAVA